MLFFFCKQKTAYEMRISDWSSDVCSSDLNGYFPHVRPPSVLVRRRGLDAPPSASRPRKCSCVLTVYRNCTLARAILTNPGLVRRGRCPRGCGLSDRHGPWAEWSASARRSGKARWGRHSPGSRPGAARSEEHTSELGRAASRERG